MDTKAKKEMHLKMTLYMFLTIAAAGVVGFVLLKYAMPGYYFKWYPAIPAYFALLSIVMALFMAHYEKRRPGKILVVFMLTRTIKFTCTIAVLLLYYGLVHDNMLVFGVMTFIFYMIHMVVELAVYNNFAKSLKNGTE